jgi:transcriptional regulator with GAF, ATPase, and Fis domain
MRLTEIYSSDSQTADYIESACARTCELLGEVESSTAAEFPGIIGRSHALRQVLRLVEIVAPTDSGVLFWARLARERNSLRVPFMIAAAGEITRL